MFDHISYQSRDKEWRVSLREEDTGPTKKTWGAHSVHGKLHASKLSYASLPRVTAVLLAPCESRKKAALKMGDVHGLRALLEKMGVEWNSRSLECHAESLSQHGEDNPLFEHNLGAGTRGKDKCACVDWCWSRRRSDLTNPSA